MHFCMWKWQLARYAVLFIQTVFVIFVVGELRGYNGRWYVTYYSWNVTVDTEI